MGDFLFRLADSPSSLVTALRERGPKRLSSGEAFVVLAAPHRAAPCQLIGRLDAHEKFSCTTCSDLAVAMPAVSPCSSACCSAGCSCWPMEAKKFKRGKVEGSVDLRVISTLKLLKQASSFQHGELEPRF